MQMAFNAWVAFDDTDDYEDGCTTFVMYNFIKEFLRTKGEDKVIGLPRLIRLNPYVPFKTRGNAAVAVMVKTDDLNELLELGISVVSEFKANGAKTSPGIVISKLSGEKWFYHAALSDVIPKEVAERLINKIGAIKWGGRGIVGALAAIMADLNISTFELLAYRDGEPRPPIDGSILKELSELTEPFTFANMDGERPLIVPSTNDPVLFGIRGDSAYHVIYFGNALLFLMGKRPKWLLYKTNQGTGANLTAIGNRVYQPSVASGYISSIKRSEEGHLLIDLGTDSAIIYRHTGMAGSIGQYAFIVGGRRPGIGNYPVYSEYVFDMQMPIKIANPRCPRCGSTLKSAGKGELKCEKCGFKSFSPKKVEGYGSFRESMPRAGERRHLANIPERVGLGGLSNLVNIPHMWIT